MVELLERKLAVNPFGKKVVVDKMPEIIHEIKMEGISDKVNNVLEKYMKIGSLQIRYTKEFKYISRIKLDVLSPLEINLALQLIMKTNINPTNNITGFMISRLVNDSYKAGNNQFNLTVNDCSINALFRNINGTEKNPIIASVFGNVGRLFGFKSEHCTFDVKGNTSFYFGIESKHCNYLINGDVDYYCGNQSENCTYDITGNAEAKLGIYSQNSIYNLNGDADVGLGYESNGCTYNICGKIKSPIGIDIKDSVFKVVNENNYSLLVHELPASNTVQLMDSASKIIREIKK